VTKGEIFQIQQAHKGANPSAENPAWQNSHHDCGKLLAEIERLRDLIDCATNAMHDTLSTGGADRRTMRHWVRKLRVDAGFGPGWCEEAKQRDAEFDCAHEFEDGSWEQNRVLLVCVKCGAYR
jgi:hypothetical protein